MIRGPDEASRASSFERDFLKYLTEVGTGAVLPARWIQVPGAGKREEEVEWEEER